MEEMTLHNMTYRAFCQATEDEAKVTKALLHASGAEQKDVTRTKCEGYHGNPIVLMEVTVSRARMVKEAFLRLSPEDRQDMLDTLEDRIDDECTLFLRLDKQEAFHGRTVLGESGEGHDVISVHGKVKTYPKSQAGAIEVMRSFLTSLER